MKQTASKSGGAIRKCSAALAVACAADGTAAACDLAGMVAVTI
ncbi:MAG: hypothetical protein WBX22_05025 [Silvibacterium sp.]